MSIDIIGAGIGGLSLAIALEQKGISVRLFEQAEQFKPVGAGIILANNAMQVYRKLGLKETIEENGNRISAMNITQENLVPISEVDLAYFENKHKVKNIAIHRGTLQEILINALKTTEIHLDHRLVSIDTIENNFFLCFENGKRIHSATLIGADGIKSQVRNILLPGKQIRKANQVCWRGVTDFALPNQYKNELNEAWGKKDRFGFVQIAENKVYWYALKSFNGSIQEFTEKDLAMQYAKYHPLVKDIINSTPIKSINTAEITDLKPSYHWYSKQVCLIGDAAHATTPNLGQGACQAIEDADMLAECLNKYETNKAFEIFQKLRLPKAHKVVKTSWMLGKIAHLSNPLFIKLRNQTMRMVPSSINRKQSEEIFQIQDLC